jgi:hypothetical protein
MYFQRVCGHDNPVELPADGYLGSRLDGRPLQHHVHEGKLRPQSRMGPNLHDSQRDAVN